MSFLRHTIKYLAADEIFNITENFSEVILTVMATVNWHL